MEAVLSACNTLQEAGDTQLHEALHPLHGCLASEAMTLVCTTQSINAAALVSCFLVIRFDVLIAYCMSTIHAAVHCIGPSQD